MSTTAILPHHSRPSRDRDAGPPEGDRSSRAPARAPRLSTSRFRWTVDLYDGGAVRTNRCAKRQHVAARRPGGAAADSARRYSPRWRGHAFPPVSPPPSMRASALLSIASSRLGIELIHPERRCRSLPPAPPPPAPPPTKASNHPPHPSPPNTAAAPTTHLSPPVFHPSPFDDISPRVITASMSRTTEFDDCSSSVSISHERDPVTACSRGRIPAAASSRKAPVDRVTESPPLRDPTAGASSPVTSGFAVVHESPLPRQRFCRRRSPWRWRAASHEMRSPSCQLGQQLGDPSRAATAWHPLVLAFRVGCCSYGSDRSRPTRITRFGPAPHQRGQRLRPARALPPKHPTP